MELVSAVGWRLVGLGVRGGWGLAVKVAEGPGKRLRVA